MKRALSRSALSVLSLIAGLQVMVGLFTSAAKTRTEQALEDRERGSMTVEQVIWLVVISGAAVLIATLIFNLVKSKANQINLG